MTEPVNAQPQAASVAQEKQNDKEYNFAQLRKQAEAERYARLQTEAKLQELERQLAARTSPESSEDDDEPVDRKTFRLSLKNERMALEKDFEKKLAEDRENLWVSTTPDYNEVLSKAEKFASEFPEIAEALVKMPEGLERKKLVYNTIKRLTAVKEEQKPNIQEIVDKNRRSPYYQPSGVGTAPYGMGGDFSPNGQKSAYDKMQELKRKMRL